MLNYPYGPAFGGFPSAFGPGPMMPMGYGFGPAFGPGAFAPFGNPYWYPTTLGLGWGLGGERRWGGTYTPQFIMTGLPTDEEIEEMIYDSIDADPMIPYNANIEVNSDAGVVTLTGTVPNKTIKHAAGDDAWWIPGVNDVRNEIQVERRPSAEEAARAVPGRPAAAAPRRPRS
jgi:hypothetical protein